MFKRINFLKKFQVGLNSSIRKFIFEAKVLTISSIILKIRRKQNIR